MQANDIRSELNNLTAQMAELEALDRYDMGTIDIKKLCTTLML